MECCWMKTKARYFDHRHCANIYRAETTVNWCPALETVLAQ